MRACVDLRNPANELGGIAAALPSRMLAAIPLCNFPGTFFPGIELLPLAVLTILALGFMGLVLAFLLGVPTLILAMHVWERVQPHLPKRSTRPELRLCEADGSLDLRWPGLLASHLTADDSGLQIATPLQKPRQIDADDVDHLELVAFGDRHALVVATRRGTRICVGRSCRQLGELERARAALARALRLGKSSTRARAFTRAMP